VVVSLTCVGQRAELDPGEVHGVKAPLVVAEKSWESLQELQDHMMQRADQLTGEFQQQQWSLGLGSVLDMAAVEER